MTTRQFLNRLERIRENDKRYDVYPKLLKMVMKRVDAHLVEYEA